MAIETINEEELMDTNTLDLSCEFKRIDTDEDGSFEGYGSVFKIKI